MSVNIPHWLRKSPQPVAILADQQRIEVARNARGWRELAATIASLAPEKLTALDGQNNVLRSITLESNDEEKPQPSAEMADLQLFAKLLAEAYDKASSKMQPIVDSAMAFVERGGTRLAKVESENDRLRATIAKQSMQIAELSGAAAAPSGDDSLLGTIVAGAMQAATGGSNPLLAVAGGAKPGGKKP